jgi:transcription antitermination factor NusG
MAGWWCVQTRAQREHMVRLLLMRHGFETYAPRIKHHGRIAFLFPTYLFIAARKQFYSVLKTPGVVRLLMCGDQPADLGAEVITEIHKRESRDGLVRLPAARQGLVKGQGVRVTKGSFCGHIGLYDGMSSHERVRVLLELLGRKVSVEMAESDLTPLDIVANG